MADQNREILERNVARKLFLDLGEAFCKNRQDLNEAIHNVVLGYSQVTSTNSEDVDRLVVKKYATKMFFEIFYAGNDEEPSYSPEITIPECIEKAATELKGGNPSHEAVDDTSGDTGGVAEKGHAEGDATKKRKREEESVTKADSGKTSSGEKSAMAKSPGSSGAAPPATPKSKTPSTPGEGSSKADAGKNITPKSPTFEQVQKRLMERNKAARSAKKHG